MNNRIFDTEVQNLKYKVIKELIIAYDNGKLKDVFLDVPKKIMPGPKPTMRCCVYKERAILQERLKLAMGGDKDNPNVVEVIDIACDECPIDGVLVTPACRGCIVHRCVEACPKGAISIVDKHSVVDKSKCIECGKCVEACPYNALIMQTRPCVKSCHAGAISVDENKKAKIDNNKCLNCGACVYQCPFGAVSDKSYILDALDILKKSKGNTAYNVYAVVAPSIASQFSYAKIGQVVDGLKRLGFSRVVEAALGADAALVSELEEFKEHGTLTTSCCPSFVRFIEVNFPELTKYVSSTPSPMVITGKLIKERDKNAKVIFIGPCSSKKREFKLEKTGGAIDCVLSFEELQAFFDARSVEISALPESSLDDASYYGRIFARSGGLTEGLKALAEEQGVEVNPIAMNGLEECRKNLTLLKFNRAANNFFEGMACDGGCINGALCLHHGKHNAADVDKYGRTSGDLRADSTVERFKGRSDK